MAVVKILLASAAAAALGTVTVWTVKCKPPVRVVSPVTAKSPAVATLPVVSATVNLLVSQAIPPLAFKAPVNVVSPVASKVPSTLTSPCKVPTSVLTTFSEIFVNFL